MTVYISLALFLFEANGKPNCFLNAEVRRLLKQ